MTKNEKKQNTAEVHGGLVVHDSQNAQNSVALQSKLVMIKIKLLSHCETSILYTVGNIADGDIFLN
jgi:hypothetical protein